jgi:enterochelin esterase family protein
MIAGEKLPAAIAVFVNPGDLGSGVAYLIYRMDFDLTNRSTEYDSVDECYSTFLIDEVLPLALKDVKASSDPANCVILGMSSGGPCDMGVGWHRNDVCGCIITSCDSFSNMHMGNVWQYAIRRNKAKDLKIFPA